MTETANRSEPGRMTSVFIGVIALAGLLTAFSYLTVVDVAIVYEGSDADVVASGEDPATGSLDMTSPADADAFVTTATGLQYVDHIIGDGEMPQADQNVVVHYTGWIYENGEKGEKFDSSVDRGEPFVFALGQGQVIRGWDEGLASMQPGGKRTLIIPPDLGYGDRGAGGGLIPGGATLMFDVELLEVK